MHWRSQEVFGEHTHPASARRVNFSCRQRADEKLIAGARDRRISCEMSRTTYFLPCCNKLSNSGGHPKIGSHVRHALIWVIRVMRVV